MVEDTAPNAGRCDSQGGLSPEKCVTVTLRCQNCGFTFVVTYQAAIPTGVDPLPMTCGHCRSSRWTSQSG